MAANNLVWFITGANTGFGLLLSQLALSKGHTVVATARAFSKFPEALRSHPKADLVEIQMTAPGAEIAAAIDAAANKHGRIDVLVNNAGFGQMGAAEEVTEQEARYQFDVNFFGLLNFTKAAIPHMRKQHSGVIVNISSGVGILAPQGAPLYAASKFAVEGLSESMAAELKAFGIRTHIVEPGVFRTEFLGAPAAGRNVSQRKEGYVDMGGLLAGMRGHEPGNPELAVQRIFEVVTGTGLGIGLEDQLRIPLGSDCFGMLKTKIGLLRQTAEKLEKVATSTDF
jgi:NAD(P)-dependent dehydrogenase (short-subunit alcohol dehydrogenase family)